MKNLNLGGERVPSPVNLAKNIREYAAKADFPHLAENLVYLKSSENPSASIIYDAISETLESFALKQYDLAKSALNGGDWFEAARISEGLSALPLFKDLSGKLHGEVVASKSPFGGERNQNGKSN